MPLARRVRRTVDIWPGFVDALATLVMVIVFLLMIFVLAQYYLGQALSGRQKALDDLGRQMAALAEKLNLETKAKAALELELESTKADKAKLEAWASGVQQDMANLLAMKDEKDAELAAEKKVSEEGRAQLALLSQQIEALKQELARVNAALEASEAKDKENKAQIADLGKRLNVALAGKVEELQKYRSEFFGRLRKVLGNRPGIRIDGDRFVFQSELLFASGSADLGPDGTEQVHRLAETLKEIMATMPKEVNWVLRVDGHTDKRPISGRYKSNWDLSTARAITVLRTLAADGIPKDRLAAAGFGEFQPVDNGTTEAAYAKNRRIEIRFDQR